MQIKWLKRSGLGQCLFDIYVVDLTLTLTLILFHFTKTVHMIFYNSHLGYKMTNDGKYFNNY